MLPKFGTITGTVTDTSGSPIKDVLVWTIPEGTTTSAGSAITGINGTYTISNLPQGTYTIKASKAGYLTQVKKDVWVGDLPVEADFKLQPIPVEREFFSRGYNYPNPATGDKTTFRYYLFTSSYVTIEIYDLNYDLIKRIYQQGVTGWNEIDLYLFDIDSGTYIYIIKAEEEFITNKLVVIK